MALRVHFIIYLHSCQPRKFLCREKSNACVSARENFETTPTLIKKNTPPLIDNDYNKCKSTYCSVVTASIPWCCMNTCGFLTSAK